MSRKKTLSVIAALILSSAVASCGGTDSKQSSVAENCKPAHSFTTVAEGKLTVSVYVTPPYTIKDGSTYKGVDSDAIKKIAAMECLEVDFKEISAAGLIQSVQSERADTALGGIYRTPERANLLELSDTVYNDGMVLLSKEKLSTIADMTGKSIGVIQGYLWTEDLQKALGQDGVTIYMASDGMVNDLKNGRLDAAVLTTAEAAYRIDQAPDLGFVATPVASTPEIAASQSPGEVVFPAPKGNTELSNALSADIQTLIQDGSMVKILAQYNMPESASAPRS